MDSAGIDAPAMQGTGPGILGREVAEIATPCPLALFPLVGGLAPKYRGFSFPAAVRAATGPCPCERRGKSTVPAPAAFSFLAFLLCGIARIASQLRGVRGDLLFPVPFSFAGCA